jgi:U-box domain
MDCPKCNFTQVGGTYCLCELLISQGNCEFCLNYGEYCTCDIEYQFDNKYITDTFTCPITQRIFIHPYLAADGHTYEKEAIEKWLYDHDTSPLTGSILPHKFLLPNLAIQSIIRNTPKKLLPRS